MKKRRYIINCCQLQDEKRDEAEAPERRRRVHQALSGCELMTDTDRV